MRAGVRSRFTTTRRARKGSQRHRVGEILLLDEATSALDAESEGFVQVAIETLRAARTVIIIAHRRSTVRSVARLIVLDGGRVAEERSRDELIRRGGYFARLWETPVHALS